MPARAISIANRHPRLRLNRRTLIRAIHTLDERFAPSAVRHSARTCPAGDLTIVFLTDPILARLHADFLADPAPTDVITFGGDRAHGIAGEICVSVDAALRHTARARSAGRAASASKKKPGPFQESLLRGTTAAFSSELTLYLVHGWLHLAGYDDLVPTNKRAMRRAEARALRLLRAAKSLPSFTLRRM
ncbi:MAG: rRNA maturation RNAse YbeY [Verrucomicrobiota bacterium]